MNKMKTEIINHPTKGLCILISNIDINAILKIIDVFPKNNNDIERLNVFSNIEIIASDLRAGRRISAIKEVRKQTGWDLKKAKEYLDNYYMKYNSDNYNLAAFKFMQDHMPKNFISKEEFNL